MFWVAIVIFIVVGMAFIVWNREMADVQAMLAGARMHRGCAVAEGIALLVLAAVFYLAMRAGAFG